VTGAQYWLLVLGPFARDGYRRGLLDRREIVLFDVDGREVHLPRPQTGWLDVTAIRLLDAADGTPVLDEYEAAEPPVRLTLSAEVARRLGGVRP
jgi:hypothetical protein